MLIDCLCLCRVEGPEAAKKTACYDIDVEVVSAIFYQTIVHLKMDWTAGL